MGPHLPAVIGGVRLRVWGWTLGGVLRRVLLAWGGGRWGVPCVMVSWSTVAMMR